MTILAKHAATIFCALALTAAPTLANEVHFTCDGGTQVTATFSPPGVSPGSVVLVFPKSNAKVTLPQLKSADGARYGITGTETKLRNKETGEVSAAVVEFWTRGRDATWTVGGRSEKCQTK